MGTESGRRRGRRDHLVLGRRGEDLAAGWYEARGGRILARNWRCRAGELDLVVAIDQLVVFCEVKTRSSQRYGSPFEAVDRTRIKRIRAAASEYLRAARPVCHGVRFDVTAVIGDSIEVRSAVF